MEIPTFFSNAQMETLSGWIEIYRGEYYYEKSSVKLQGDDWKTYFATIEGNETCNTFNIYKREVYDSTNNLPLYTLELTPSQYNLRICLDESEDRKLFELCFTQDNIRFLIAVADEDIRIRWIHGLMESTIVNIHSNECYSHFVSLLENTDTKTIGLQSMCYLHIFPNELMLSTLPECRVIAKWPLNVIKSYACKTNLIQLEIGSMSMYGQLIVQFQTYKSRAIFDQIKKSIEANKDAIVNNRNGSEQDNAQSSQENHLLSPDNSSKLSLSAEYLPVNITRQRISQYSQYGYAKVDFSKKSQMNLTNFILHEDTKVYDSLMSPSSPTPEIESFEPFEEYDILTRQDMRSHSKNSSDGSFGSMSSSDDELTANKLVNNNSSNKSDIYSEVRTIVAPLDTNSKCKLESNNNDSFNGYSIVNRAGTVAPVITIDDKLLFTPDINLTLKAIPRLKKLATRRSKLNSHQ